MAPIGGVRAGYISGQRDAILDTEDWEHNDLTGRYGGDTGAFEIRTSSNGEVDSGTYALFADGSESLNAIVSSQSNKFERSGVQINFSQYHESGVSNAGGIILSTSVDGYSNIDGYEFYFDADAGFAGLYRLDNGSRTSLTTDNSFSITEDSFVDAQIKLNSDDSFDVTYDGSTISGSDGTYQEVYYGFVTFDDSYIGTTSFSTI